MSYVDINIDNRWRNKETTGGSRETTKMVEIYYQIQILLRTILSHSQVIEYSEGLSADQLK